MEQGLKKSNTLSLLHHFLYLIFITGLIFSFRAVTSISIGLIFLTGIITNKSFFSSLFHSNPCKFFIGGCMLFFLLQFVSLIYTHNRQEGWNQVRLKTGLVITPIAIYCSGYLCGRTAKKLLFHFCVILAIASLYCLVIIFFRYQRSGGFFLFFYHDLVSPLKQHAIYFSIFVFIALVFLLESMRENYFLAGRALYMALILFFSLFLFFLSSKLVIIFFIGYSVYFFIWSFKKSIRYKMISLGLLILVILSGSLLLTTHNPLRKRFAEIIKDDITLVKQESYSPADYFNGLQFRMLQWKLVPEILDENKAWLKGVGAGDARYYLDRKYISKNMYTGDPERKDHGFLGYNTHDQFLQALLQDGVTGLLVFGFTCFGLLKMLGQKRRAGAVFISLLLITYSLTESVFETQFGIILFTFFPLLIWFSEKKVGQIKTGTNKRYSL